MRALVPTSEQYSVFRAYLDSRHRDGGMADMTVLDYAMMVEDSHVKTRLVEYRRRGPDTSINGRGAGNLLAVALTDVLSDGLSMVYSFFDPEEADRSLGTFMILDHIERAKRMGLPYVYLGYWVRDFPQDGLQGPLPAAGAADAGRLDQGHRRSRLAHVPEKWVPVFRKGHAQTQKSRAHPGSSEPGWALAIGRMLRFIWPFNAPLKSSAGSCSERPWRA